MPRGIFAGRRGPKRKDFKDCAGCGQTLARSEFYQRANGHVVSRCKECSRKRSAADPKKLERKKTFRVRHADKVQQASRLYHANPINKVRRAARVRARKATDPAFAIEAALRRTLADKIRAARAGKSAGTIAILGCSIDGFMHHIAAQFVDGMSWSNWGRGRGKWNLDHVRPIASFDLLDPRQQVECFHYRNFQPLWWIDNLRKGAKWNEGMCGV
jgi:hypothetical protein